MHTPGSPGIGARGTHQGLSGLPLSDPSGTAPALRYSTPRTAPDTPARPTAPRRWGHVELNPRCPSL